MVSESRNASTARSLAFRLDFDRETHGAPPLGKVLERDVIRMGAGIARPSIARRRNVEVGLPRPPRGDGAVCSGGDIQRVAIAAMMVDVVDERNAQALA